MWNVNKYTITFETDGGSEVESITADFGTAITAPAAPTKEGYTFIGWSPELPETMPAEDITLTAVWEYTYTGWAEEDGNVTYLVNGEKAYFSEWVTIEGEDYYFDESGYVVRGLSEAPSKDGTYNGRFIFDDETGALRKDINGLYNNGADTFWAQNGELVEKDGLVRIVKEDGEVNYYYFVDNKAVKNDSMWLNNMNGLLLPENEYTFDEYGVILHDEDTSKNGIIEEADGEKYYYIDGVKAYMGLIQIGEDYYYINSRGKMVRDCTYWISRANGLLPEKSYKFDKNGKIVFVLRGDLDDDGDVDNEDAIYMLYHTIFDNQYPLNQNGDFNGDGSVDNNDAIYLLYHTIFGAQDYPLSDYDGIL